MRCDQGCRKNDTFTHLVTLPTKLTCHNELALFSRMVYVEMKEEMKMSIFNYKDCHNELALFSRMVNVEMKKEMKMSIFNYKDCHNELALFSRMVYVEMKEEMKMSIFNYKDCHNELALFSRMVNVEMKKEMKMSIFNYKDITITTRTGLEFGEYGKPCLPSIPENKASRLNLIGSDLFKFFTIWCAIFFSSQPSRRMDQQ